MPSEDPRDDPGAFWDQRYDADDYRFGTEPNVFLKTTLHLLRPHGTVLELACGEGRNAVAWAVEAGHVTAVDASAVGIAKARRLAAEKKVSVEWVHADLLTWQPAHRYDAVITSFLHSAPDTKPRWFALMREAVAPGGFVAGEWFRPEQRTEGYTSGGPPDPAMMVSADELRREFAGFHLELLEELVYTLNEGRGHGGPAAVVRMIARAPYDWL
ncbi:MAG: class I SAM-dependent methyltransferase [Spirochaetaceae bacterium]|nr:MAG: class I SAM-dependent methyltransferase [Spirochaetaceae bacterium]